MAIVLILLGLWAGGAAPAPHYLGGGSAAPSCLLYSAVLVGKVSDIELIKRAIAAVSIHRAVMRGVADRTAASAAPAATAIPVRRLRALARDRRDGNSRIAP